MGKVITGFEFAILVAIIIGIIILLHVMEARRRINAANSQPQDDDQAKEDERQRRRMVHEADAYNEAASMEPFCGGSDAHTRSREAVARAQAAARASMKPGQP